MLRRLGVLSCVIPALLAWGCSRDDGESVPVVPACDALELELPDGSCIRPGVPVDGCAEGFEHDGGYGCEPILPAESCPMALMAVPGETQCREVMPCGGGTWGDIPVDASTIYVDQSYTLADSDGSALKPWAAIGDAVAAAPAGALIAIARGSYNENVLVTAKPVRMWGVCPAEVEIVGTGPAQPGCPPTAVCILEGADATELHGIALRGAGLGMAISGAQQVWLERVWIHDAGAVGIDIESTVGPTSVRMTSSLVEANHQTGVLVLGAEATLESIVVRNTLPRADQTAGTGIIFQLYCNAQGCDSSARSNGQVLGSLVDGNHDHGIAVLGSDATVEATVVRGTMPRALDLIGGRGIAIQRACDLQGVCNPDQRANVTLRGSLVDGNHESGVLVSASDAVVENSVVRGTLARPSDGELGRGIHLQQPCEVPAACDLVMRASATLRSSLVENNHDVGLIAAGSHVTMESMVVRRTLPRAADALFGSGVRFQFGCDVQGGCDPSAPSDAIVSGSLIEQNHEFGLLFAGSEGSVEATVVRATAARAGDGLFGDGVAAVSALGRATASIRNTRIDDSARAGLASFGASASLGLTAIQCASFALNGEPFEGFDFVLEDGGGNRCGCPAADGTCQAVSAGLEPPTASAPAE